MTKKKIGCFNLPVDFKTPNVFYLNVFQGQIRGGRSAAAVGTRVHQGQGGQGQADNSLAYNQGQGGEYSQDSSLDHDSYHSHNQPHSSENSHFVYQVEEI